MKRFLGSYIAPLLGLISLLMPLASSSAAEKVTSTGYALITSSINKDIFRTRAIENALQKINIEDQAMMSVSPKKITKNVDDGHWSLQET